MTTKTQITYGNSAKINKGDFNQEGPLYSAQTVFEGEEEVNEADEFMRLKGIVDPLLAQHIKESTLDLSHVRIREKDDKKYPSVTSIISPDPLPASISPEYGIRGKESEAIFKHWIATGEIRAPEVELKQLSYDAIQIKPFIEKFGEHLQFGDSSVAKTLYHEKHLFSGECDLFRVQIKDRPFLIDIKTGQFKYEQLIAYKKCEGTPDDVGLAFFDLKNCKIVFLKEEKEQYYWERFLIKRGRFFERFGV